VCVYIYLYSSLQVSIILFTAFIGGMWTPSHRRLSSLIPSTFHVLIVCAMGCWRDGCLSFCSLCLSNGVHTNERNDARNLVINNKTMIPCRVDPQIRMHKLLTFLLILTITITKAQAMNLIITIIYSIS